jgi:membrane-associated phospholipid phosphatase
MRRSLPALLVATACALAAAVVWLAARTGWGASLDHRTLTGFAGLKRPLVDTAAGLALGIAGPIGFAMLAIAVVAAAVVRGRVRVAFVVGVVMVAAALTTQGVKALMPPMAATTLGPAPGSWPSGHTTAVMVLALCAVLVAPPRVRPLVAAAGGLAAAAVAYSLLILRYHFPSDVAGGYLVAAGWTALGVAALHAADSRWAAGAGRAALVRAGAALRVPAAAAALAVIVVAALAATRLHAVLEYAEEHTAFVAGAAAIGAATLAAAVATAVAADDR